MKTHAQASPLPIILDAESQRSAPCRDGFGGLAVPDQAKRAEVLHRAHSIWESKGRGDDHQLADWLEAEAEVLAET